MVEITPEIKGKALRAKNLKELWNILKPGKNEKITAADLGMELLAHWQKLVDEERGYSDNDPIHRDDREFFRESNRKMEKEFGPENH